MGVDFRVLGPFEVIAGSRSVRLGGPQPKAVLVLLVLRANQVVPTDALVATLWGEAIPASATAVVRTYVSRLRQALQPVGISLGTRAPGYVLEIDPEQVDAHRFSQLVLAARHAIDAGRPAAAATTLERALGLWRGPALADLTAVEGLRPLATSLEEQRLAAVEDRMDAELGLGHHAAVVTELEPLTREHPFRERLWGQRIVALYRSGRQADALATYQELRTALVEQLGVLPGPELRALEQQVLVQAEELRWRGAVDPGEPAGSEVEEQGERLPLPPGIVATPDSPPLVGRADERALLERRLAGARTGRFGVVLVCGPPGIGKTALARWLGRTAHAAGAAVTAGWADEESGVPFQPLREAIGHWSAHAGPAALEALGEADEQHLARFVPSLAERRGTPGTPSGGPVFEGAGDRQRAFEAVARWVEALAASGPALIVLEDLHWADPATLLAIRHLLRHPPAAGVLLLATLRSTDVDAHGPLADVLAEAGGNDQVDRIDLGGLRGEDVVELLEAQAGDRLDEPGRALAVDLAGRTGGNPLFIHEVLRHRERQGTGDVPRAVTELIARRLRRLPPRTTEVLRAAAVLGEHFDLPVLSRTVDLPELAVLEALEPAQAAELTRSGNPGGDRFAFAHALMREAVLDGLPLSRRVRTHWRAGQALAAQPAGPERERRLGEAARHLTAGVRAGDRRVAAQVNVEAGGQALAALAFEEALTRFATAVELAGGGGDEQEAGGGEGGVEPGDPELAYAAWLGLAVASGALTDLDGLRRSFVRAAGIAHRRGHPDDLARAAVGIVAHGLMAGDHVLTEAPVAELLGAALDAVGGHPTVNQCALLAAEAVRAVTLDRWQDAQDLAAAAADAARRLGDPSAEACALMARCWTLLGAARPQELRECAHRALAQAVVPETLLLVWHLVAPLLPVAGFQLGERDALRPFHEAVSAIPETRACPHVAVWVRGWEAAIALGRGRFAEVVQLAENGSGPGAGGVGEASTGGDTAAAGTVWRNVSLFQAGLAGAELGYDADLVAVLTGLLAEYPAEPGAVVARALLASLHAAAGHHGAAAQQVAVLRRQCPLDRLGWRAPFVLRHLAEVAAHLADPSLAADLLTVLTPYSGQMLVGFAGVTVEAAADRAIGQLLLTLGRLDDAVGKLAAAHRLERSAGASALAARTAYWQARARLVRGDQGDHEAASRLLDEAASEARRLGMAQLRRQVDGLVRA